MVENADLICNLVYDYYKARILFGVCRYGDDLPSIPKIGDRFQMAPRTVRSALKRLEDMGYIEILPRKPAKVIYQAKEEQIKKDAALYFVPRMKGIMDFCRAGKLLIEPVWEFAQMSLDEEAWSQVRNKLDGTGNLDLSLSTKMHIYVFAALQNKLIINFYWEVLRYICFPYLVKTNLHVERDQGLLLDRQENEIEFLKEAFEGDFGDGINSLFAFCSWAEKEYALGDKQIPFNWTVYRQRPQLCYTLVSRIILKIITGVYPRGSSLPSMPEMSKQLNVSYRTLRRALSLLGSLGIIRLHQGKEAEVCNDIGKIDFERPEIQEGFRLYKESLQFMAITVRPVYMAALQSVSKEERDALVKEFIDMFSMKTCHRCFKLTTDFIITKSPSSIVRDCYGKLSEFLVWGYPFVLYRFRKKHLQAEYAKRAGKVAECIVNEDWEGFAEGWQKLLEYELKRAEHFFSEHNMQDKKIYDF